MGQRDRDLRVNEHLHDSFTLVIDRDILHIERFDDDLQLFEQCNHRIPINADFLGPTASGESVRRCQWRHLLGKL